MPLDEAVGQLLQRAAPAEVMGQESESEVAAGADGATVGHSGAEKVRPGAEVRQAGAGSGASVEAAAAVVGASAAVVGAAGAAGDWAAAEDYGKEELPP